MVQNALCNMTLSLCQMVVELFFTLTLELRPLIQPLVYHGYSHFHPFPRQRKVANGRGGKWARDIHKVA